MSNNLLTNILTNSIRKEDINSLRESKHDKIKEVLFIVEKYITGNIRNLKYKQNVDVEIESQHYYSFIEQEVEVLLDINNYCIIDIEVFEKVKVIFKLLINCVEEESGNKITGCNGNKNKVWFIINDLYYIFKYIYESILFMIENEFLLSGQVDSNENNDNNENNENNDRKQVIDLS